MNEKRRSSFVAGLVLILLGVLFLAIQLLPGLRDLINIEFAWPLIVVAVGAVLLVIGVGIGAPAMAVPACIVGGIGCLLFWQNATDNWESWAYAWTLIPGFVGVGTLLSGLLGREAKTVRGGAWLILISGVLFAIFGSFLGPFGFLGDWWPLLVIALGVLLLIQSLLRHRE